MKSFLIIGMGKFGHHMCEKLAELGNELMVVDELEEKVEDVLDIVISAKVGDCTRKDVLDSFGVDDFDACFVCISDNFQSSLEITYNLSELGAKNIISLASTDIHAKFLLRNGANHVIYPERDMARRLAVSLSNDSIFDYIQLSSRFSIMEVTPLKEWIGKNVVQANIRAKYRMNVLAIKDSQGEVTMPGIEYIFNEKDHVIVMGQLEDLNQYF